MGKKKQQQRPKRKKISTSGHDKDKMKEVLKKLADSKSRNQNIIEKSGCITQMHVKHKKIHKLQKKIQQEQQDSAEQVKAVNIPLPQLVNIFAVNSFVAQKPVIVNNAPAEMSSKMQNQLDLQSRARKAMGSDFNLDRFGDKPMRVIQQQEQEIALSQDQKDKNLENPHPNMAIPSGNRPLPRPKDLEQFRKKLPIFMKEQQIIETINTNLVTLICGQTGSGKSTQLPQFLIQKNYQTLGKIGITQPRRLAAVALARRVAQQMGFKVGKEVAYQVRHERLQSDKSVVKFMTDGILLKQMSSDPLLLEYSVVVIDQAHERKLNTDILIGLLSRLILLRYKQSQTNQKICPLRLVIMSATLRIEDFQNLKLFNFPVPILKVDAKMFPVTIFHEKNTPENYLDCAVKKCLKIHKQLPPGDVLIFLTGKQQIKEMSLMLQMGLKRIEVQQKDGMDEEFDESNQIKAEGEYFQPVRKNSSGHSHIQVTTTYSILQLYSSLPPQEQSLIFEVGPSNCRRFIISTNIAETSLTVPNIRYVIDAGQEKFRYFDKVWKWRKGWGTRAMAMQRSGRAGRVIHGYCYRLYSGALYANIMEEYPDPEICRLPLESVVLQVKAIGFKDVFGFPFPTPPSTQALKKSLDNLLQVGAIEGEVIISYKAVNQTQKVACIHDNCSITQLGRIISFIPLSPHLAKMLLLSHKLKLSKHVIIIVILLTVQTIFKSKWTNKDNDLDFEGDDERFKGKLKQLKRKQVEDFYKNYGKYIQKDAGSDLFIAMNIAGEFMTKLYSAHSKFPSKGIQTHIHTLCSGLGLSETTMLEFFFNSDQIIEIFETLTSQTQQGRSLMLSTYTQPTPSQCQSILSLLLSTFHKNLCRFEENNKYTDKDKHTVFINRTSVLYKQKGLFVGAVELYQDSSSKASIKGIRRYMRYPFKVDDYELLVSFGKIKELGDYDWDGQKIVVKALGELYGWEIPNLIIKDPKGEAKFYAFSRMLLEGRIIKAFSILKQKNLLNGAVSTIRPDNLAEKVQRLVMELRKFNITSKQSLLAQVKMNKNFLSKELKLWINANNYEKIYIVLREAILKQDKA